MANNFTTNTASIRATVGDIRKLNSRVLDSKEIKLDGTDIRDLWGFQEPEDFKKLVKRCELPEGSNYILWTDTGQVAYMSFADKLINGSFMFAYTALESFNIDLLSLTTGYGMFALTPLQSFSGDLSSLTNGTMMFAYTALQSFSSDLSSLTSGGDMFGYCKLDLTSVQNIASTINTVSSGEITLGVQSSLQGNTELEAAINAITSKGWRVTTQYNA